MKRMAFLSTILSSLGLAKAQIQARPTPNRCPYCGSLAAPLRLDSSGKILAGWTGAILSDGKVKAGIGRCRGCSAAFWQDAESPRPPASWRRIP